MYFVLWGCILAAVSSMEIWYANLCFFPTIQWFPRLRKLPFIWAEENNPKFDVFLSPSASGNERKSPEDDIERFTLVNVKQTAGLPCNFEIHPTSTANERQLPMNCQPQLPTKRSENLEEMRDLVSRKPSMCAKCVACAAAVFALIKQFEKVRASNSKSYIIKDSSFTETP